MFFQANLDIDTLSFKVEENPFLTLEVCLMGDRELVQGARVLPTANSAFISITVYGFLSNARSNS